MWIFSSQLGGALSVRSVNTLFTLLGATKIDISGVAGAGIGYQVRLVVDYDGTLHNDGLNLGLVPARVPSVNDSGSVRFYSAAGAQLPMFVEAVDGQTATVWVKIYDDLDSDQSIYMLDNGDAGATNVSDGNAVFELFDHFNAGALDTSKWSGDGVDFVGAGQAAYARLPGADADITLQSLASFGDGYELVVVGRFPNASVGGHGFITGFSGQYSYYNPSSDTANSYIAKGSLGVDEVSQGSRIANSVESRVSIARSGGVGRVIGANAVNVPVTTNSTGVAATAAPVTLNHVYAAGQTGRVNYVFVRRWTGVTEPVVAGVRQLVGLHDHGDDAHGGSTLRPSTIRCSGDIEAIAGTSQIFGVRINGTANWDNHGVQVNTVDTGTNKIGNVRFSRNGNSRWTIKKHDDAETGSGNAGSSLHLQPHPDSGSASEALNFIFSRDSRMSIPSVPPASATAAGRVGTIQWDADYIYVCVAADTWKRVAIATW